MISVAAANEENIPCDFQDVFWGDNDASLWPSDVGNESEDALRRRGRSLSPAGRRAGGGAVSVKEFSQRKQTHSVGGKPRVAAADADAQDGGIAGTGERRYRSSSLGNRAQSGLPMKASGPSQEKDRREVDSKIADDAESLDSDACESKNLSVLRSLPSGVSRQIYLNKGNFRGFWTLQHPLQVTPHIVSEVRISIQESNLSEAKKFEWELDLMREFDEKRIEKYESFLVGCRSGIADLQLRSNSKYCTKLSSTSVKKKNTNSGISDNDRPQQLPADGYYRDKGKYPTLSNL
jgi:hypothetical protein